MEEHLGERVVLAESLKVSVMKSDAAVWDLDKEKRKHSSLR